MNMRIILYWIRSTFGGVAVMLIVMVILMYLLYRSPFAGEILNNTEIIDEKALLIISLLVVAVSLIIFLIAKNIINHYKYMKLIESLHLDFAHILRSKILELDNLQKEIELTINPLIKIDYELYNTQYHKKVEIEFNNIAQNLKPCLDLISDHLSRKFHTRISTYLEIFNPETIENEPIEKRTLITIAKCENTHHDYYEHFIMRQYDHVESEISPNNERDFYNEINSFQFKHHKNTLVVPIEYVKKKPKVFCYTSKPDRIGFICINSKDPIYNWKHTENYSIHFLSLFTDFMYIYLKKFNAAIQAKEHTEITEDQKEQKGIF